jgi:hypothetical protein
MAIWGEGNCIDITLKCGNYTKTTTSQYKVVGMGGTTSNADFTAFLANNAQVLNNTNTAYMAIGINQTYLSASSESMQVRVAGVSKAYCESTICAGDFVGAYYGISTTTYAGAIFSITRAIETNVTTSVYGLSIPVQFVCLGRALQYGETATYISILVQPSLYDLGFVTAGA